MRLEVEEYITNGETRCRLVDQATRDAIDLADKSNLTYLAQGYNNSFGCFSSCTLQKEEVKRHDD